jgi:hypothetical protein
MISVVAGECILYAPLRHASSSIAIKRHDALHMVIGCSSNWQSIPTSHRGRAGRPPPQG